LYEQPLELSGNVARRETSIYVMCRHQTAEMPLTVIHKHGYFLFYCHLTTHVHVNPLFSLSWPKFILRLLRVQFLDTWFGGYSEAQALWFLGRQISWVSD